MAKTPKPSTAKRVVHPLRPGSGVGASNGTGRSQAFDRWFRYPAGFAPGQAETLLKRLHLSPGETVCDPFAGSGVVGTSARMQGLAFYGIEAHPLIADLARTKLASLPEKPDELAAAAQTVERSARHRLASAASSTSLGRNEHELVRRCFEPEVLAALVALRRAIDSSESAWRPWLRWALIALLRDVASVRVGWPYQLPAKSRQAPHGDPFGRFLARVGMIQADLATRSGGVERPSTIVCGDSGQTQSWNALDTLAAGCLSSPPYLNNFDYADATRLEMYFLGYADSWASLCRAAREDMVIATTQQTSVSMAEEALDRLLPHRQLRREVIDLQVQLKAERISRPRGKEYDRVLPVYVADMVDVIKRLAESLKAGARVAWVVGDSAPYGVYIDTPRLLTRIAKTQDLKFMNSFVLRERGKRWALNGTRHQVALDERVIEWRKIGA